MDRGLTGRQPKAVQSALAILEAVARAGAGISAKEVAETLGLPPATTYRLLNLLVAEEYLVRLPDLHGFALGRKVAVLTGENGRGPLPTAVREVLAELRNQVRSAIHLMLYTPTTVRCADIDPDHPLPAPELIERHLHASAVGKLLLAEQADWAELLNPSRLHRVTQQTVTRAGDLDDEVRGIRDRGWAAQAGQLHDSISCAAVPVRSPTGLLVAALVVTVYATDVAVPAAHVDLLAQFAPRLGPLLG